MITFSGYGLIIVVVNYFGGLFVVSKLVTATGLFPKESEQYVLLLLFHVLITVVNYFVARFLNQKEIRHTVFGAKLETVVLVLGLILAVPLLLMGKDIFY